MYYLVTIHIPTDYMIILFLLSYTAMYIYILPTPGFMNSKYVNYLMHLSSHITSFVMVLFHV